MFLKKPVTEEMALCDSFMMITRSVVPVVLHICNTFRGSKAVPRTEPLIFYYFSFFRSLDVMLVLHQMMVEENALCSIMKDLQMN